MHDTQPTRGVMYRNGRVLHVCAWRMTCSYDRSAKAFAVSLHCGKPNSAFTASHLLVSLVFCCFARMTIWPPQMHAERSCTCVLPSALICRLAIMWIICSLDPYRGAHDASHSPGRVVAVPGPRFGHERIRSSTASSPSLRAIGAVMLAAVLRFYDRR